jgi:hypothetical protein
MPKPVTIAISAPLVAKKSCRYFINRLALHSPENRGDLSESCLHVYAVQFYLYHFALYLRLPSSPKASNLSSQAN